MRLLVTVMCGALIAAAGCGTRGPVFEERDAGGGGDAAATDTGTAPGADAGPDGSIGEADSGPPPTLSGGYWTLEEREATVRAVPGACEPTSGGTAIVIADIALESDCDEAGPVAVSYTLEHPSGFVEARAWVYHPRPEEEPCAASPRTVTRHVPVMPWGDTFTISGGDTSVEIMPREAIGADCTFSRDSGSLCTNDCECRSGLHCIPLIGGGCETGICARTCDPLDDSNVLFHPNQDCPSGQACVTHPGLPSPVCEPQESDLCSAEDDCPEGHSCPATDALRQCSWEATLSASTRRPCTAGTDCDPGLRCVVGADGRGRCDVPCATDSMRCPAAHVCGTAGITGGVDRVCEWIGD